jgi:hypothetical protein
LAEGQRYTHAFFARIRHLKRLEVEEIEVESDRKTTEEARERAGCAKHQVNFLNLTFHIEGNCRVWICGQIFQCTLKTLAIRVGYIVWLVLKMLYRRSSKYPAPSDSVTQET